MALLEIKGLKAYYGQIEALHGFDLSLEEGEITAVLGANGAGKTTTLRALRGMVKSGGSLTVEGENGVRRDQGCYRRQARERACTERARHSCPRLDGGKSPAGRRHAPVSGDREGLRACLSLFPAPEGAS